MGDAAPAKRKAPAASPKGAAKKVGHWCKRCGDLYESCRSTALNSDTGVNCMVLSMNIATYLLLICMYIYADPIWVLFAIECSQCIDTRTYIQPPFIRSLHLTPQAQNRPPIDAEKDLLLVTKLREKERRERPTTTKDIQLSELGLADNCTEVRSIKCPVPTILGDISLCPTDGVN